MLENPSYFRQFLLKIKNFFRPRRSQQIVNVTTVEDSETNHPEERNRTQQTQGIHSQNSSESIRMDYFRNYSLNIKAQSLISLFQKRAKRMRRISWGVFSGIILIVGLGLWIFSDPTYITGDNTLKNLSELFDDMSPIIKDSLPSQLQEDRNQFNQHLRDVQKGFNTVKTYLDASDALYIDKSMELDPDQIKYFSKLFNQIDSQIENVISILAPLSDSINRENTPLSNANKLAILRHAKEIETENNILRDSFLRSQQGVPIELINSYESFPKHEDLKESSEKIISYLHDFKELYNFRSTDSFYQMSTVVTRLGAVIILIFLVQIFVRLFRYCFRLAAYFDSRADAISLFDWDNSEEVELEKLVQLLSPDAIDIGQAPKALHSEMIEFVKSMKDKT